MVVALLELAQPLGRVWPPGPTGVGPDLWAGPLGRTSRLDLQTGTFGPCVTVDLVYLYRTSRRAPWGRGLVGALGYRDVIAGLKG